MTLYGLPPSSDKTMEKSANRMRYTLGRSVAALLERGGRLEAEGTDGPRHDWTFEFASGPDTLTHHISRPSVSLYGADVRT